VSLVTPLSRALGLGSAKDGVEHWWAQRLSAVVLALLSLWFVFAFVGLAGYRYVTIVNWMQVPLTSILMVLTLLSLGYHSQLGVQTVIEDYVHAESLKVLALILTTFVHICVVVAGIFAVLKVALGATG